MNTHGTDSLSTVRGIVEDHTIDVLCLRRTSEQADRQMDPIVTRYFTVAREVFVAARRPDLLARLETDEAAYWRLDAIEDGAWVRLGDSLSELCERVFAALAVHARRALALLPRASQAQKAAVLPETATAA